MKSQALKTLVQATYMKVLQNEKCEDIGQISVSLGLGKGSDSVGTREIFRMSMF